MQNEELRAGGKTQTRWGPAGLQLMLATSMLGKVRCGGRTYPAASGIHTMVIIIREPVHFSTKVRRWITELTYEQKLHDQMNIFLSERIHMKKLLFGCCKNCHLERDHLCVRVRDRELPWFSDNDTWPRFLPAIIQLSGFASISYNTSSWGNIK